MPTIVRFPPSPTGALHIGSARTALFNWLYARHTGGKFLLRIEDTDKERSTPESVKTILDGLNWLELKWDNPEILFQSTRAARHAEVAKELLAKGKAYPCYCSPEELEAMRAEQKAKGLPQRYDGRWRDRDPKDAPAGVKPVIRIKMPQTGETVIEDKVLGKITVQNSQLDDMVLLRGDGSPTYMLAVVVDDHDMGVNHVIRGDDHMTNTFRQVQIIRAMGWPEPVYAHLPLILGPDGSKMSKRHGATSVAEYAEKGYLPEAMRNYLLRLCWSHGDDEIISTDQAIEWFGLDSIGKSPARFDFAKLASINAHYIKLRDDRNLAELTTPFLAKTLGQPLSAAQIDLLTKAMPDLKTRAQTIVEIAEMSVFFFRTTPLPMDDRAKKLLTPEAKQHLAALAEKMKSLNDFTSENIEALFRTYAEEKALKLGNVAQPLRAALTGSTVSPPIFGVAALLGKEETLKRMNSV